MRAAARLAALLLAAPLAWAQDTSQAPEAVRPPERPEPMAPEGATRAQRPESRPGSADRPTPSKAPAAIDPPGTGDDASPQPSGPPQPDVLRETDMDFSACLLALYMLGARYEVGAEVTGPQRDCGIARPVTLAEALPGLVLEGAPSMRCETARALGWWLRDHVIPAARHLPGAPKPVALTLGSTYQCRGIVRSGGGSPGLSEHAFGNALDIAAIRFDAGEAVNVAQAGGTDMAAAFIAAIRGAACLYFTTVLGPGSDAAHDDHLHLDIKERSGGYRLCQ